MSRLKLLTDTNARSPECGRLRKLLIIKKEEADRSGGTRREPSTGKSALERAGHAFHDLPRQELRARSALKLYAGDGNRGFEKAGETFLQSASYIQPSWHDIAFGCAARINQEDCHES